MPQTEKGLQSLWKALDFDASGFIDAGEFGHFMRRGVLTGEPQTLSRVTQENLAWRDKLKQQRRREMERNVTRQMSDGSKAISMKADRYENEIARLEAELAAEMSGERQKKGQQQQPPRSTWRGHYQKWGSGTTRGM